MLLISVRSKTSDRRDQDVDTPTLMDSLLLIHGSAAFRGWRGYRVLRLDSDWHSILPHASYLVGYLP